MAHIKPFCAIRPNPKIELQFCSKPFQLYSKKELKSTLENCPNSFLQIIKSNIDKTSKNSIIADIIMQPKETELLKRAKILGRSIHYGKYMIESQIDLVGQFLEIW